MPVGPANAEYEVVVVVQPVTQDGKTPAADLSWPGFIARTYGSIPDLEEPEYEGNFEEREWPA